MVKKKKLPSGFTCVKNTHTGARNQEVSVLAGWQSGVPHCCVSPAHSPAPQDTGTQPWPSSTRSWCAAMAELYRELVRREPVCRNTHKGSKKQSGHTRSHWPIHSLPFRKKRKK